MILRIVMCALLSFSNVCLAGSLKWAAPYNMAPGQTGTDYKEWLASSGEIFGFDDVVVVRLRFDQESVDAFNYVSGLALEVDLIHCTIGTPLDEVTNIKHTFPSNFEAIRDTTSLDDLDACKYDIGLSHVVGTLLVANAKHIVASQDYYVYFHLNETLPTTGGKRLRLNLQISMDALQVTEPLESVIHDAFGSNFLDPYEYFNLETDTFASFWALSTGNPGTCWGDKESSGNCSVSQNQCLASLNKRQFNLLDFFFPKAYATTCSSGTTASSADIALFSLPNLPSDPSGNGPDGNIKHVEVSPKDEDNYKSTLTVDPNAEIHIEATVDNKGDQLYDEPEVTFYLDGGERNLDCDDDDEIDTDEIDDLSPGETHTEGKHTTAPSTPGTYWVYACIDSDVSNDTDTSNNHSKDSSRDEWVKLIVQEPVPPPTEGGNSDYASSPCAQAGYTIEQCMAILNIILD